MNIWLLNPFEVYLCWHDALTDAIQTRRMEQEVRMQCNHVGCPLGQNMTAEQVNALIENAGPVRVFLHHSTTLTSLTDHPLVLQVELKALQVFIANFHTAERALAFRVGASPDEWTSPDASWHDEFCRLLIENQKLYLAVFCYDTATKEEHNVLLGTMAKRLQERMLAKQAQAREQFE